jgi:hypothetical protein
MSSWCKQPTSSGALEGSFSQLSVVTETGGAQLEDLGMPLATVLYETSGITA